MIEKKRFTKKKLTLSAMSLILVFAIFEILSSSLLIYVYRYQQSQLGDLKGEVSYLSSVNLIYKASKVLGFTSFNRSEMSFDKKTSPDPFIIPDVTLGYSASPNSYTHTFLKRHILEDEWQSLRTKVTINQDGSRWTGNASKEKRPKIYIFGDSFVFGTGVNDEQTFSYLLQSAMPSYEVKLFAFGGYSLTQAYLRFEGIKDLIEPEDIIVLGYADYYDVRHVQAPQRIRTINEWTLQRNPELMKTRLFLPKASLDKRGEIDISYINRSCAENNGYCKQSDPSSTKMTTLTAALINHIAQKTDASVYLLHFDGNAHNPTFKLLTPKVNKISALSKDFDYFIHDDIEGFDTHPGPYWHYAMSRKLLETLNGTLD